MTSTPMRIAIVGAGPAGLSLAVLLRKSGIPATIFDLRQRLTDEELARPSGSLDLHEETGLAALKACGLYEAFTALNGDCTEAQVIADRNGNILFRDEGEGANRPEIARHELTKLLLSELPDSTFKWGHKLIQATRITTASGQTETELDFGENGKHTFDLVVGADGAWSKIRRTLVDVKPIYAGIHNITLNIGAMKSKHPELGELVGPGTFTCLAEHHGVLSQRSVQESARIYVMLPTEDEHFAKTSGLIDMTPAQAKSFLLDGELPLKNWGTKIKTLVATACDSEETDNPGAKVDIKPLYRLPVGQTWTHQPGVTVIGDAAHLMCPWAGEGVNLAMRDSLDLSQAVVQAHKTAEETSTSPRAALDSLLEQFEVEMVARAKEEAEGTLENGEMMFGSEDGSGAFVRFMESHGPPPMGME